MGFIIGLEKPGIVGKIDMDDYELWLGLTYGSFSDMSEVLEKIDADTSKFWKIINRSKFSKGEPIILAIEKVEKLLPILVEFYIKLERHERLTGKRVHTGYQENVIKKESKQDDYFLSETGTLLGVIKLCLYSLQLKRRLLIH